MRRSAWGTGVLTAVGDFFKSTFGESLKKPLQPAGLFAAAIFVLLNAAFTYPALITRNAPIAVAIRDSGSVAQVVLISVTVLVLAYVLISMSTTILKIMTGELWGESPVIARYFIGKARSEITSSAHRSTPDEPTKEWLNRRQRLLFELPDDPERAAPTALGNVLAATASYLQRRYGIELSAVWGHMETVLASDSALAARLNDEKSTLDFLSNLSFVLLVFAFELALVGFALRDSQAILALLCLALAWGVYRAAVAKARSWSAEIRLAFDLYRDKLRHELGLPEPDSTADERAAWRSASRALRSGDASPRIAPSVAPMIESSENAVVSLAHDSLRLIMTLKDGVYSCVLQREYAFFVRRAPELRAAGVRPELYFVVTDPRVRELDGDPEILPYDIKPQTTSDSTAVSAAQSASTPPKTSGSEQGSTTGNEDHDHDRRIWERELMPRSPGAPVSLLWKTRLPHADDAVLLRYCLALWRIHITPSTGLSLGTDDPPFKQHGGLVLRDLVWTLLTDQKSEPWQGDLSINDAAAKPADTRVICGVGTEPTEALRDAKGACKIPSVVPAGETTVRYLVLTLSDLQTSHGQRTSELLGNLQPGPEAFAIPPVEPSVSTDTHGPPASQERQIDSRIGAARYILMNEASGSPANKDVSNTLGCAWAWLHDWDTAERYFDRARAMGLEAASINSRVIESARHLDVE